MIAPSIDAWSNFTSLAEPGPPIETSAFVPGTYSNRSFLPPSASPGRSSAAEVKTRGSPSALIALNSGASFTDPDEANSIDGTEGSIKYRSSDASVSDATRPSTVRIANGPPEVPPTHQESYGPLPVVRR